MSGYNARIYHAAFLVSLDSGSVLTDFIDQLYALKSKPGSPIRDHAVNVGGNCKSLPEPLDMLLTVAYVEGGFTQWISPRPDSDADNNYVAFPRVLNALYNSTEIPPDVFIKLCDVLDLPRGELDDIMIRATIEHDRIASDTGAECRKVTPQAEIKAKWRSYRSGDLRLAVNTSGEDNDPQHVIIRLSPADAAKLLQYYDVFMDTAAIDPELHSIRFRSEACWCNSEFDLGDNWLQVSDANCKDFKVSSTSVGVTGTGVKWLAEIDDRVVESQLLEWCDIRAVANGQNPFEPV